MPATVLTSGNVTRIILAGEFDFSTQEELKQVFDNAINTVAHEIQLDMADTIFIDSSIIRMFLKLHDTAQKNKKSLTIMNCSERIYEILTIGGFDQVFDIQ